ncbi:hypothetical protein EVAR_88172_1 [Eumeta japonica]|uniref:Histone-lysine N-methyltransferase SETMAR n=1 Tax=Eumeta variegata TaxID=151549 RepID=A0A4C1WCB8_EUMVA|nr:hypothetical protein EVAR_88172_1 [Eumeta japonica]
MKDALKDTGFSEIDHPPCSPDLAPSDHFLFSNLKKELRSRRFVDDNQMKMAVESHFDCKEKEYFLGGLKALYTRYGDDIRVSPSSLTPLQKHYIDYRDLELPTISKYMKDASRRFSTSRDHIPMRSYARRLTINRRIPPTLSVGHETYLPIHLTLLQRQLKA